MEQEKAIKLALAGHNLFITGKAGTGKSYTLNKIIKQLKDKGLIVSVTASTGIASTHISGRTIHSWAGIGIKTQLIRDDLYKLKNNPYSNRRISESDVLIIDEISMLHDYRLDMVDQVCRFLKNKDKPFGGLQIIVCGDFFQLPPVERSGAANYCFNARSWKFAEFKTCYLQKIYRQQDDPEFIEILNNIRSNNITIGQTETLRGLSQNFNHTDDAVNLYCKNVDVDAMNRFELSKIEGDPETFEMTEKGLEVHVNSLKKNCLAPEYLQLKVGARVIHLVNDNKKELVNGTIAEITDLSEADDGVIEIKVLKTGKILEIERYKWELKEYQSNGTEKTLAWIKQFPLKLSWALTVHKSQGATFDFVNTDLTDVFNYNMGYVALSRATSMEGLFLKGFNDLALLVDPVIIEKDKEFIVESEENDCL